jgi:predicted PurR-regulated permease PerM
MSRFAGSPPWQQALIVLSGTAVAFLAAAALTWGRAILLPIAAAVFIAFVLSPVVRVFRRQGVPRVPSILLTVAAAVTAAAAMAWLIGREVSALTLSLPDHRDRIVRKVAAMKHWFDSEDADRLNRLIDEVGTAGGPPPAGPTGGAPVPVVVDTQPNRWKTWLDSLIGPAAELLGQAGFTFVLVVFFLFKKEDLRDRLIRLVGGGRVTTATKALDDASRRVSRFLLAQFLFNASFGMIVALGLFLLGVQFALLWGFLIALMRYVPYVGTWIGVIPPTVYAFAVTDTCWQPVGVLVLVLGSEVLANNFIEPVVYGASLGLSNVAQVVAAGFWAFLWGPVGLILSGPLSACLLVLGKHIPHLSFLDVLLGDDPPLETGTRLYQRLVARDVSEVSRLLATAAADGLERAFDADVIPALRLTKEAAVSGELTPAATTVCLDTLRDVLDDLPVPDQPAIRVADRPRVLVVPAKDEVDEVACELLARTLSPVRWDVTIGSTATLTGELADSLPAIDPAVVVIGSVPPGGVSHVRYLCKRLRPRFPSGRLIVGRWGGNDDPAGEPDKFRSVGADEVTTSLADTHRNVSAWFPVVAPQGGGEPAEPSPLRPGKGVPATAEPALQP